LISLTDDYRILVSHNKVPAQLRFLFETQMNRIHLPNDERLWASPSLHSETSGTVRVGVMTVHSRGKLLRLLG
jgi:hypothetical protein